MIYFVTLVAVPCGDKDDCNDLKKSELCQTEHNEHNDEDHEDEACTPFCVCSCCAAHFVTHDFQAPATLSGFINSVYTFHKDAEPCSAIIPIWQPPKLVC